MITPDGAPLIVGPEPQTVAHIYLACRTCDLPVPLTIDVWTGVDEDGDEVLYTAGSTLDLEAHLASHGPVRIGRDQICEECGEALAVEGFRYCTDCLGEVGP